MKIGLVLPGFSATESDWCIPALLNLVRRLAFDHNVHVFALEYPYRKTAYSVYRATIHSLGGRNRGKWYAPRLWSDALSAIYAEHRRAHFDVLHAFWVNEPGAIAVFAGRLLQVPVVASVAGGELVGIPSLGYGGQLHWFERGMVSLVMSAANRVTVGSRYLQQIAKCSRPDVDLLPLGVDTSRFAPGTDRTPDDELKILNVGSLVPIKQQVRLLEAFAQQGRQDACLQIVGHGVLARELREHAHELGVTDRVTFLGEIRHNELASRYGGARLVVQSSRHEAQGMGMLEAAACGIPLAGTPVGILPELAEAGGAVTSHGFGTSDLATAMADAIERRDELRLNARQTVESRFGLEESNRRWMELYQSQRELNH